MTGPLTMPSVSLIASIVPPGREERRAQRARVTLHDGEELQLERSGDLGERNAGMLIFADGRQRPEYVSWTDVEQVDFDRPPAMFPPLGRLDHGRSANSPEDGEIAGEVAASRLVESIVPALRPGPNPRQAWRGAQGR